MSNHVTPQSAPPLETTADIAYTIFSSSRAYCKDRSMICGTGKGQVDAGETSRKVRALEQHDRRSDLRSRCRGCRLLWLHEHDSIARNKPSTLHVHKYMCASGKGAS